MDKLIKTGYLVLLIWLCLSQLTLNQRQYAVKRIQNSRQSKDLKRFSQANRHRSNNQLNNQPNNQPNHFSSRNNPFQDFLGESTKMMVVTNDWNDIVNKNDWNGNSWTPPANAWKPPSKGWQQSDGWENGNNGWWQQDPWKDPYTKLSLVKIKPEIQEVYAADVLIRENRNSNFGINGFLQFVQFENYVEINGIVCNLPPGKHAMHIHKFGEISGGCHETRGDFNPYNVDHAAPELKSRHLGDLGNIEANSTGIAVFRFKDKQIKIQDKVRGIIGRSVVIHEFEDDMGLTQVKESKRSGDAGGRLACGVVGISQASNYAQLPMTCNRKN